MREPVNGRAHQLDALLTTDGDGDRPLLADEQGEWLRGDIVGLLCARALGIDALAVPVSCNSAIEGSGAFTRVLRTRIGSPYVLAGMEQLTVEHHDILFSYIMEDWHSTLDALGEEPADYQGPKHLLAKPAPAPEHLSSDLASGKAKGSHLTVDLRCRLASFFNILFGGIIE